MTTSPQKPLKIAIDDLSRPLHRIFPVWIFEQMLQLRQMTLVSPRRWEDPYEDICSTFMLRDQHDHAKPQLSVAEHLAPAWAQCWSYESNSDLLLRSYSRVERHPIAKRNMMPGAEGVRVTTTASLLLKAMEAWAMGVPGTADSGFALGRVTYLPEADLPLRLVNLIERQGLKYLNTLDGRAHTLLLKRDYFRHEDEVRLICTKEDKGAVAEFRHFSIEPNDLFTEIAFDPRLLYFERLERERTVQHLGYNGKITRDTSYEAALHIFLMENGWKD
ncbi:hypothetical protein EN873_14890 [bacterium M00.F.Ca.ET.230.01.1.1]|nr:hypothetical protein EN873_14890 [bacterium M00.F.Ca.ET.230.01.1.1]